MATEISTLLDDKESRYSKRRCLHSSSSEECKKPESNSVAGGETKQEDNTQNSQSTVLAPKPIQNSFNPRISKHVSGSNMRKRTVACVYKMNEELISESEFSASAAAAAGDEEEEERLSLSGCAVVSKGSVVVEGGISSVKKYCKIMLRKKLIEDKAHPKLVWQGKIVKPSFEKFSILHCSSEAAVKKFFSDHGVSHYWQLANDFSHNRV